MAYKLKLLYLIRQLYPIFNIVKLFVTLENPILGCKPKGYPLFILINKKEEWEVEEILDSYWYQRWFQYLIKQKGYSHKHNFQKPASKVSVPNLMVDFYCRYLEAPRYIYQTKFDTIFLFQTYCFKTQQPQRRGKCKGIILSHTSDTLVVAHWSDSILIK